MRTEHNRVVTVLAYALTTLVVLMWSTGSSADTATEKAGRGLAAITTPFLELPGNIVETSEREGPLAGWTMGLAKGLGMTVVRPLVGVYELVTAPIAAPAHYEPILQPEYPWSYFGTGRDSKLAKNTKHSRLAKR
jgi:putative exosortase-associated protein (TIGR04073 family)